MGTKWIGALLIVASCGGWGFFLAVGKRQEEKLVYQLMAVLQFMESELQYRLTPLPELCRLAAGETRGVLQTVFINLYRELSWQKLPDAGSCMHAAIQRSGELPSGLRRLLVQLGHTLGRFDLSGQLEGIQAVRSRCQESMERIRKDNGERLRSYQTLGICAGAALAIILI